MTDLRGVMVGGTARCDGSCGMTGVWGDHAPHVPATSAAPDRPGDRDQKQAAELRDAVALAICPGDYCEAHSECRDDADNVVPIIAVALAAARAEEAAQWQAKIEALLERSRSLHTPEFSAADLRAVLDGAR